MPLFDVGMPGITDHVHHSDKTGWLTHIWAVAMLLVIANSYLINKYRNMHKHEEVKVSPAETDSDIQRLEFSITGMKCSHCADSVERGLVGIDGVQTAKVELKSGRTVVTGNNLDQEMLSTIVNKLGYKVKG